jgi:hypothetical protein
MKNFVIRDKLAAASRRSGAGCARQPTAPEVHLFHGACSIAAGKARTHVAAVAVHSPSTCTKEQQLLQWVQAHGGYVHPNLAVQAQATLGMRGVVAVGPIGTGEKLVVVPEHLCMTSVAAKTKYSAMFGFAELTDAFPDSAYALALMLAVEKRHAQQPSFWQPYIAALPDQPSCAWWMDAGELAAASSDLRRRFPELDVAGEVDHFRSNTRDLCRVIALTLGTPLGVTEDDMFWALGQVRLPVRPCRCTTDCPLSGGLVAGLGRMCLHLCGVSWQLVEQVFAIHAACCTWHADWPPLHLAVATATVRSQTKYITAVHLLMHC